jgi:DNA-binding NtrC family response regulator
METQTQSILVVEDSSSITFVLQLMLEGEGYHVLTATSVDGALEILRTSTVDLILTDAFSATPQAALSSVAPLVEAAGKTPIALLTGHQVSLEEAQAQGFCTVIRKPFDLDTLVDQVRACLDPSGVAP